MELDALCVHVAERDFPLRELADVKSVPHGIGRPRPHITSIPAVDVVGQEVDTVDPHAAEVIEPTDQAFTLTAFPGRIAFRPVANVRCVVVDRVIDRVVVTGRIECPIKIGIGEHVLGRIGAGLEVILAAAGKLKVVLADITQHPLAPVVHARLVGGQHGKRTRSAIE